MVKLSKGRLITDLHVRHTDRNQYLHFNSSHSDHTKKLIIYNQALTLTKICTFENDFLRHRYEMKSWFHRWSYPKDVINTKIKKRNFGNFGKSSNKNKGVPFLLTSHSLLKILIALLENTFFCFIWMKKLKKYFSQDLWYCFKATVT